MLHVTIAENVLYGNVELSHVIFAPSVSIPANTFDERDAHEGHIEADLPFRVEVLADGRCRLFRFAQSYHQVLQLSAPVSSGSPLSTYRITCPRPVLCRKVSSLQNGSMHVAFDCMSTKPTLMTYTLSISGFSPPFAMALEALGLLEGLGRGSASWSVLISPGPGLPLSL